MKNVRTVRRDGHAVSPVIATILMVAITVVLAAVLYVMVMTIIVPPEKIATMTVSIQQRGESWSVEVISAPSNPLPSSTYLLVRDPDGVLLLATTLWSELTQKNWETYKALYQDANPTSEAIRTGDSLLLSVAAYPAGSSIVIMSDSGQMASGKLA